MFLGLLKGLNETYVKAQRHSAHDKC
jgi:hypothetical protein